MSKYHGLSPGTMAYNRTKAVHDMCEKLGITPDEHNILADLPKIAKAKNAEMPDGDVDYQIDRLGKLVFHSDEDRGMSPTKLNALQDPHDH